MPPARQRRLADLTAPFAVEVRATRGRGDGVFATAALEEDVVVLADVPLAWLPYPSPLRLPPQITQPTRSRSSTNALALASVPSATVWKRKPAVLSSAAAEG